jgi:hypothetical protein
LSPLMVSTSIKEPFCNNISAIYLINHLWYTTTAQPKFKIDCNSIIAKPGSFHSTNFLTECRKKPISLNGMRLMFSYYQCYKLLCYYRLCQWSWSGQNKLDYFLHTYNGLFLYINKHISNKQFTQSLASRNFIESLKISKHNDRGYPITDVLSLHRWLILHAPSKTSRNCYVRTRCIVFLWSKTLWKTMWLKVAVWWSRLLCLSFVLVMWV